MTGLRGSQHRDREVAGPSGIAARALGDFRNVNGKQLDSVKSYFCTTPKNSWNAFVAFSGAMNSSKPCAISSAFEPTLIV